jgi:hypothetical protein
MFSDSYFHNWHSSNLKENYYVTHFSPSKGIRPDVR